MMQKKKYDKSGANYIIPMEKSKHFVLVHGACSGAWCWYKLATLLTSAGHRVTAVDLGASGIHPKQLADYSQPLMDVMASVPEHERVVLVGHSFGGMNLALAMESFPEKIAAAVFVTASMPSTTLPPSLLRDEFFSRYPLDHYVDTKFTFGNGPENPPTSLLFGPKYTSTKIYQLSPPEDSMLARPTSKEYQSMTEDFQRWMVEHSPPDEVGEMDGADHVPMMSKPGELYDHLLQVADKYGKKFVFVCILT